MKTLQPSACANQPLCAVKPEISTQVTRQIQDVVQQVAEVIAPVWPLQDYVAVNPYAGLSTRSFMGARKFLQTFSDCETLMPLTHYAAQYQQGRFGLVDIEQAISERQFDQHGLQLTAAEIANLLLTLPTASAKSAGPERPNRNRQIHTIAEYATSATSLDWSETIREEVSKYCSTHYDQGQATWSSPYQTWSLFQAWRTAAKHDRNIEILGMKGFRRFVSELPLTPEATITRLLSRLGIPSSMWLDFLLSQAFSIPGWSAWAKYQTSWSGEGNGAKSDLICLLAIRLAYDAALADAKSLRVNWNSLVGKTARGQRPATATCEDDSQLRYLLLTASEIAFRRNLLRAIRLADQATGKGANQTQPTRKMAQLTFCIDVRSERIRRQLEATSEAIETGGFAGFFGMPIEYVPLAASCGKSHVPVLLKPKFKLFEGLREENSQLEQAMIASRLERWTWRKLWKGFQSTATSCFAFVETVGLGFGPALVAAISGGKNQQRINSLARRFVGNFVGHFAGHEPASGPTLRHLAAQNMAPEHQVDLVESMLRNMSMTENFARLVVFCGHASETVNNPLAAGLDCGACGGHSGEPNARLAALLLNQPQIRELLADRGIEIPADTYFLGGLHNTVTDEIQLFDQDDVPASHRDEFQQLLEHCATASENTLTERLPSLAGKSPQGLLKRAGDWSEVRPEWGLAGNSALVVAPRSLTNQINLAGQVFLHNYDHRQDATGNVLETIMTAPMIVAHWINMQYYASTVDQQHFGSGNKTVHNVVGRFGILSGNGGDLMTGLPWQSLHNGREHQHLPLRLQVVIAAQRASIERIINAHSMIEDLLAGDWLQIIALDDNQAYRFDRDGSWVSLSLAALRIDTPHLAGQQQAASDPGGSKADLA